MTDDSDQQSPLAQAAAAVRARIEEYAEAELARIKAKAQAESATAERDRKVEDLLDLMVELGITSMHLPAVGEDGTPCTVYIRRDVRVKQREGVTGEQAAKALAATGHGHVVDKMKPNANSVAAIVRESYSIEGPGGQPLDEWELPPAMADAYEVRADYSVRLSTAKT